MAILSVLERDQFSEIKKGTKLYELVLADKALVAAILVILGVLVLYKGIHGL